MKIYLQIVLFILHLNLVIKCSLLELILKNLNSFCTTSFSILKNKEQITHEMLFEEIEKKKLISISIILFLLKKYFNCDFERGISNAAEKYFLIQILNTEFGTIKEH